LECDEECLRLQRNAKLKDAFKVDEDKRAVMIPYPSALLEQILKTNMESYVYEVEHLFADFLKDTSSNFKFLQPLKVEKRWVVHNVGKYYDIEAETSTNPLRSGAPTQAMRLHKTQESAIPKMLVSKAIELYKTQRSFSMIPKTVPPELILEFNKCKYSPLDLQRMLSAWKGEHRLTWVRPGYAVAVFTDHDAAEEARIEFARKYPGVVTPFAGSTTDFDDEYDEDEDEDYEEDAQSVRRRMSLSEEEKENAAEEKEPKTPQDAWDESTSNTSSSSASSSTSTSSATELSSSTTSSTTESSSASSTSGSPSSTAASSSTTTSSKVSWADWEDM